MMRRLSNLQFATLCVSAVAISSVALSGCTVTLVSAYDPVTDQTATDLQAKVDTFLLKMAGLAGTPAGNYANNQAFYDELSGSIDALHSRAEAIPQNSITVTQVRELKATVDDLRALHKRSDALRPELVGPSKAALDAEFKAIIAFEDAKKRGKP
jgi:outer membrane murein-binding lipoprotein Lpp